MRAHELIGRLLPDSADYADCMASIKFDLGDMCEVGDMAVLSRAEFMDIPAAICLFQVTVALDVYLFLAKQEFGGVVWRMFSCQENMGFQWSGISLEVFLSAKQGERTIIAKNTETGEVVVNGGSDLAILPPHHKWALDRVLIVAMSVEVFSCANVKQIEHPPPKHINTRRLAKGKVPFFSYRTLHIDGESRTSSGDSGVTHKSPRLHFRRGHIRRISDGRRIWVSGCLVGDKSIGFSGHDYSVSGEEFHA